MKSINLVILLTLLISLGQTAPEKSRELLDSEKLSAKYREGQMQHKTFFNFPRPQVTTHDDNTNQVVSDFVQG